MAAVYDVTGDWDCFIVGRFAESDKPEAIEKLIDENTRAVFAETIGKRLAQAAIAALSFCLARYICVFTVPTGIPRT